MMFVAYDLCLIVIFFAYDVCRIMRVKVYGTAVPVPLGLGFSSFW